PVTNGYWPLFDLHLTTPDLTLRPVREADLARLSDLQPDDLGKRPGRHQVPRQRRAAEPRDYHAPGLLEGLRNLASVGMAAWLREGGADVMVHMRLRRQD